jgi:carbon dioxide concentrating mechanism protein CcmL
MQIAIVRGTVVSTQKDPSLQGTKLLLLQFVDADGQPLPRYEVAVDVVGAGNDEWVLVSRGSAARQHPGGGARRLWWALSTPSMPPISRSTAKKGDRRAALAL